MRSLEAWSASALTSPQVRSLDQLYTRALGVAPALLERAAAWADSGGGEVDAPPSPEVGGGGRDGGGAGAADAGPLPSVEELMRRGVVKRPERAIEKTLVCYGGDASRLRDLCRARLVFSGVAGLLAAARAAVADPAAAVVGVKNGMLVGGSATGTAGFRVERGMQFEGWGR